MKQKVSFLKLVLAVVCGSILTFILAMVILSSVASSMASSSSTTILPKSGIMVIDMSKINVVEQASDIPDISGIVNGQSTTQAVSLWKAVQAINTAASDPTVKYIYLKPDGVAGDLTHFEELRKSLSCFRQSGKPVIAYTEAPSTGSYYLASVADKIFMTSYQGASTMVIGIGSRMIFLKDILDKLGINVQLIRHGKYKSAGEMFIKNAPSEENMEQNQAMIDALWNTCAQQIAESRQMTVEDVNETINELKLNLPQDFLDNGFVDELLSREELNQRLADLAVVEDYKHLKSFGIQEYIDARIQSNTKAHEKIAVIYADGEIVDGAEKTQVAGDRYASLIAKVRNDSSVKAVVFRVNSPGGSVLASEKIKAEIELLKAEKPVVASYGSYAASGGYWISSSCDKIYSDATTLTGSIGVFSMIPDFSKVINDVAHINVVTVGSNKHSDMYSLMRPFDQAELDYMQASVENIYEKFVNIVAEGRDLEPEFVDSVAQGRVWAGTDALPIGLVDEIGTLEDAINWAASAAGNSDLMSYNIVEYPKALTSYEQILEMIGMSDDMEETVLSGTALDGIGRCLYNWSKRVKKNPADVMFARIPYYSAIN